MDCVTISFPRRVVLYGASWIHRIAVLGLLSDVSFCSVWPSDRKLSVSFRNVLSYGTAVKSPYERGCVKLMALPNVRHE
jgi:hypothetical protein